MLKEVIVSSRILRGIEWTDEKFISTTRQKNANLSAAIVVMSHRNNILTTECFTAHYGGCATSEMWIFFYLREHTENMLYRCRLRLRDIDSISGARVKTSLRCKVTCSMWKVCFYLLNLRSGIVRAVKTGSKGLLSPGNWLNDDVVVVFYTCKFKLCNGGLGLNSKALQCNG